MDENVLSKEEKQLLTPPKSKLSWFYKTVCWCSGARLYLLEKCPADYNKFFGIGAVVIMTGVLASISGGYALYTVFNNYYISLVFGILWGILIFSLDWYIVSSLKKENKFGREFLSAMPRLILALLIAIVISKPLELKLFEKEINQEIETIKRENALSYKTLVNTEFDEIEKYQKQNTVLLAEITRKEVSRERLFEMIVAEAEGRSPTNKVGKGPVYKEKKAEFDKIQNDLTQLKERNYKQIDKNNEQINQLKSQKNQRINKSENINEEYGGFLGRLHAMNRLTGRNQAINVANWFIILLFIFVESAPMIVKLLSRRGPYDVLFESEEQANALIARKQYIEVKAKQNQIVDINDELMKYQYKSLIDSEKKFVNKIYEIKMQLDELKVEKWKEQEIENINKNIEKCIEPIEKLTNKDFKIYTS